MPAEASPSGSENIPPLFTCYTPQRLRRLSGFQISSFLRLLCPDRACFFWFRHPLPVTRRSRAKFHLAFKIHHLKFKKQNHPPPLFDRSAGEFIRSLKCLFTAANPTSIVPETARVERPPSNRHAMLPTSAFSPSTSYQLTATAALPPSNIPNSPSGRYIEIIMFILSKISLASVTNLTQRQFFSCPAFSFQIFRSEQALRTHSS